MRDAPHPDLILICFFIKFIEKIYPRWNLYKCAKILQSELLQGEIMRRLTLGMCILLLVCLSISPLSAQNRGASSGGDAGRGAPTGATSTSAVPSAVAAPSYSGYSSGSYTAAPIGNRAFSSVGYPSASNMSSPNLQGTSFTSFYLYNSWNDYYYYLNRYYNLNPSYFTRFYHNREPLITPAMLRLTLRQPLFVSTQMLTMIDELEIMYRDSQEAKSVDKEALIDKAQSIRKLAKVIRENRTLALIDIREKSDVCDDNDFKELNLESISKLRELALDLNRQLTDMISMSTSSTISVASYQQPSFESISKGIEKACKAIESSSKRL